MQPGIDGPDKQAQVWSGERVWRETPGPDLAGCDGEKVGRFPRRAGAAAGGPAEDGGMRDLFRHGAFSCLRNGLPADRRGQTLRAAAA